jgi:hypothetical protein
MKNLSLLLLLATLLFATASTTDSEAAKGRAVKKRLTELFAACRANDYAKAAKYIVYRGSDERREWRVPYNYSNAEDREEVRKICDRINAELVLDRAPAFVNFVLHREGKQEWGVWEVLFEAESQRQRLLFAFVKVKGKYLLGDVDEMK